LLDEQGAAFDALVGANDRLAIGAMARLKERGIRVPTDVSVVGFDDIASGQFIVPSLTTVHQPIAGQGRQAAETLLTLMDDGEVTEHIVLPARVLERRSCGCMPQIVTQAAIEERPKATGLEFEATFGARHQDILAEMTKALGNAPSKIASGQTEQLLNALTDELEGKAPGSFLAALDETLQKVVAAGDDVTIWQGVLTVLRRHALSYSVENTKQSPTWNSTRVENLLGQARVMVGHVAEQIQGHQRLEFEQRTQILNQVSQLFSNTFDIAELMSLMAQELPRLGIPSCYVSLYEDPRAPTEWSRLVLAYDEIGRVELEPGGRRFSSRKLVPEGFLRRDRQYSIIVQPLNFQETQIGFALFEMGPQEGIVYESLRGQLSSALMGALLVQQVENRALQIQTAAEVARAAGSILDPDQLILQVVELARERFGLYYAGLFLVDQEGELTGEPGRWAVLRAGTGEAGEKMLAQGWKLEIGGDSMIGQCIISGMAEIQSDVENAPVHLRNPFLPDTRSEMALPLTSRGQTIGALTIQSSQEATFTEEDIAVLQTMAGQVANAIQNARLFRRTQTALQEMEATHRRYLHQAWTEYSHDAELNYYETDHPGMAPPPDTMTPEIQPAVEQQDASGFSGNDLESGDHSALVTPIRLRGTVIGTLGIRDEDGTRHWTDGEIALVEAVVERMALAAENLRLVDETQRRAASEQLIGQIAARMRESLDMDTVLQTAIQEIGDALDIDEAQVRMKGGETDKQNEHQ
jgi:GAF domain-containing protein